MIKKILKKRINWHSGEYANDTVIFMSAYEAAIFSKSIISHKNRTEIIPLLHKHHIEYMLLGDKLISPIGKLILHSEYDYIEQKTNFSFTPANEKQALKDFDDVVEKTGASIKLLHAQSILSDPTYFNIDFSICTESFLVHIDSQAFQIDPVVFSLNGCMIIAFEVISFDTGLPLTKDEVIGKTGNYNLLKIDDYRYFDDTESKEANVKISQIIFQNISNFFFELTGKKYTLDEYSFIHNTLILSNNIKDISTYFCNLIGIQELPSSLENIGTTGCYKYYPQDGASIITNYNSNDIEEPLYAGLLLESIKLYVYIKQVDNMNITTDLKDVIRNDLYLENLFFAPHVPIETHNMLNFIYNTRSFRNHKEATKLKISYLNAENEAKRNRNGVLLNALLYIVALISSIQALETLEAKFNIPFSCSFVIVVFVFLVLGAIWVIRERMRNK